MLLAPTVNIHRHPLGGRNFECYSEDPYLTAEIAVAFIEGVQSRGVGCAVKHFACNDQETDRMEIDVVVDERTRREIYLLPFEAAVRRAGVWAVMAAYNRVDGLLLQRAPRAADRPAARRVGLRRRGDVRLVRHPQHRRTRRRPRPGDARAADGARPPPRRRRRGGRRHGRGDRAGRAAGPRPDRAHRAVTAAGRRSRRAARPPRSPGPPRPRRSCCSPTTACCPWTPAAAPSDRGDRLAGRPARDPGRWQRPGEPALRDHARSRASPSGSGEDRVTFESGRVAPRSAAHRRAAARAEG